MRKIFTTLLFAGLCQLIFAQAGTLDQSFGNYGIVRTDFGTPYPWDNGCTGVLPGADGSFYLVITARNQVFISHRLANGALDLAYGEGGYSVPVFMGTGAAVMQADGKIIIGGSPLYSNADFILARLNTNGFLDNSFSGDGKVTTDFFGRSDGLNALALQPDGKIIAVGASNSLFAVARYNPDGSLDNSFSGDGLQMMPIGRSARAYSVKVQANGSIVVAGFADNGSGYDIAFVRYLPDGAPDNSFAGDGIQTLNHGWWVASVTSLAIQPDGKIVAGGYAYNYSGVSGFLLARLNTDGTPDNNFSGDGFVINESPANDEQVKDIKLQPDGKILAAGSSYIPGYREFTIERYNTNGTPDNSFSGDGIDAPNVSFNPPGISNGSANSVTVFPDGRIMIAGTYIYSMAFAAVRYLPNGTLDNSLDGDGILKDVKPLGNTNYRGIAVQPDGKLVVAAATGVGTEQPQFAVLRYNANGTLDPSFSGDGKLFVDFGTSSAQAMAVAIQPDGKIVVAGNASSNNNADFAVVRLNADGTFDNSFSGDGKVLTDIRGYNDGATGIAIRPDGRIAVGGYSNLWGADDDFAVVQYLPDGNLDPGFSGDGKQTTDLGAAGDMANALVLQQDGKIVLAGRKGYTAQVDHNLIALVRYNTDGSLDASFDSDGIVLTDALPGGSNEAYAVAIDANGRIVVSGSARYNLAILRYTANGLLDNSFSDDGKQLFVFDSYTGFAAGLVIQPDGKLIAGTTTTNAINADFVLVRLNTDGTPDNSFSGDGQVRLDLSGGGDDNLFTMALHGNRVYAAGSSLYGGTAGAIAALLIGTVNCNVTGIIPDAHTLPKGVDANTVYIGYSPAEDLTLTILPSGGTSPYTYAWSNGATTASVTVMPTIPTTYSVTISDASGCRTTISKLVNVVDVRCGNKLDKVSICRVSPGSANNSGTQCVNANAVADHLNNGSYLGSCKPAWLTTAAISDLSTEAIVNHSGLQVYPNPSTSCFNLMLTSFKDVTVSMVVWDVVGRIVERRSLKANQLITVGSDYRPGIYFVELVQGREKFRAKLVKQ